VTELLGLLKADGTEKAWAREFRTLARRYANGVPEPRDLGSRPSLDWELLIVDPKARDAFRDRYLEAYTHARSQ
jgi:hypothetical protein